MDRKLLPPRRVLLWSSPRSLSTAFERSIRELKCVKVFNEPHLRPYYYGPERNRHSTHHPDESELDDSATFEAVDSKVLSDFDGYEAVFIKDLAFYIEGRYENYVKGSFTKFRHTFLIRHPLKSIPSLLRASKKCGLSSPLDDIGFKQLYDFYEVVRLNLDPHPIVIDADDLLANPRDIMERYCKETGLPFEEQMLTWEPGVIEEWCSYIHYKEFFGTIMETSGFLKPRTDTTTVADLSKEAQDVYREILPYYEEMYRVRLQPNC